MFKKFLTILELNIAVFSQGSYKVMLKEINYIIHLSEDVKIYIINNK